MQMTIMPINVEAARSRQQGAGNRPAGLRDILAQVDASPASQGCIDIASILARRFSARVAGLLVTPRPMFLGYPIADFGVTLDEGILMAAESEQRAYATELAIAAERRFRQQLEDASLELDWKWIVGSAAQEISSHARYVDLVVIGQPDADDPSSVDQMSVVSEILLTSGRPAIVVPRAGTFPTIGERVLIAWNGSREAARAVNDALPILVAAKSVTVLSVSPDLVTDDETAPSANLVRHLARHGIKAEATAMTGTDASVGDLLLTRSVDWSADLIVMGAYGHSRFVELLLGGATRSLLRRTTVPIFMSH
jgi:nucleotide-binding universal stress UspA family protein